MQLLIVLWMTRRITDDIPGWGTFFHGLVGDGSVSVSTTCLFCLQIEVVSGVQYVLVFKSRDIICITNYYRCRVSVTSVNQLNFVICHNIGYGGCIIVHNTKQKTRG